VKVFLQKAWRGGILKGEEEQRNKEEIVAYLKID
jgi:hypothetical protein